MFFPSFTNREGSRIDTISPPCVSSLGEKRARRVLRPLKATEAHPYSGHYEPWNEVTSYGKEIGYRANRVWEKREKVNRRAEEKGKQVSLATASRILKRIYLGTNERK